MTLPRFKSALMRLREDRRGSIMVEAVITLPLLIWAIGASYEFFEVHRFQSARDKASYTIADMISREMLPITPAYMTSAKTVFDTITHDGGRNSLRVSVVKYDSDEDEYAVKWSVVRGTSALRALTTADVKSARDRLPVMRDGEELIVVESRTLYPPVFDVGLTRGLTIATRVMTSPRFAPQINWESG